MILAYSSYSSYDSGPNFLAIFLLLVIPFAIGLFNLVVAIWAMVQTNSIKKRVLELETRQQVADAQNSETR